MAITISEAQALPPEDPNPTERKDDLAGDFRRRFLNLRLPRMPLAVKVTLIPVIAVVLLGAASVWQIHHGYKRLEWHEVEAQVAYLAKIVAAGVDSIGWDQPAELNRFLAGAADGTPAIGTGIISIRLVDATGQVHAEYQNPNAAGMNGGRMASSMPLPNDPSRSVVVAVSDHHVDYEVGWHTRHLLAPAAFALVLAVLVTWFVMRSVARPIVELVGAVRGVKAGDFNSRVPIGTRDEVGELGAAFNEMLATLAQRNQENRQLRRKLLLAQEEERRSIASELHDNTGQALTSMIARLAALKRKGMCEQEAAELVTLAAQTLHEVHELSRTLRPSVLHHLGVFPALRQLAERMSKSLSVKVEFSAVGFEETGRLPGPLEVALYRIAQEAITNAVRHGRATSVEVLLQHQGREVLEVIEDNGSGFDANNWRERCLHGDHLGLLSIEERTSLLGGTLRVESYPGRGTSLYVNLPLADTHDAQN